MTKQTKITPPTSKCAADETYRKIATQLWSGNELEIDSDATVSAGNGGAWVHAWVWVSNDEAEIEKRSFNG